MRPHHAANQIMRTLHIRNPVPNRFVDGVLQRPRPRFYGNDLRPQQPHPIDIQRLPHRVFGPHIDDALQPQHRAHRGRGHAVLPRARLGNDPRLPHPLRQQALPQRIVNLVRPGVRQILPFQVNARAAAVPGQVFGIIQRRRPPRVVPQQMAEPFRKPPVILRRPVGLLQLRQGRHHRLGNELAPKIAETPPRVGKPAVRRNCHRLPILIPVCRRPAPAPGRRIV